MAEVSISLNGRAYEIACDPGQEGRIVDLAAYIDQRVQKIARSGGAYNDSHLLALVALVLADELFEAREQVAGAPAAAAKAPAASKEDEVALAKLLENLSKRIDGIAQRVQAA
jgi:cell division protein ZapA